MITIERYAPSTELAARRLLNYAMWLAKNHVVASFVATIAVAAVFSLTGGTAVHAAQITIDGQSDQDPLRMGKAVVKILMWFMGIVGIVLWCMVPIMGPRKGNWFTYAAFGTVALCISGFIALSHRVGHGDTPELPDYMGK